MHPHIPTEARLASRVILIDEQDRVLFFRGTEPLTGKTFWLMPGGGLDTGESFEDAARRELYEETGITAPLSTCVWFRRHRHTWNGQDADQFERFFVARTRSTQAISGTNPDSYMSELRWWSLSELIDSTDDFAPRRIAHLLPAILRADFPELPIDCGV
ncbi:ADP-ribose pyrophosphatase YjhB (NUDIX family) [Roseimicrobium gellanilyticum]|uniref:ADP-ribose pyrophosphatase YjhB (NUDIX family) n=1 Tax=Roseimicrobium gellanilyticum TaxID=748857 RepID=A0A366HXN8_9BACT|nr:NUDIX domain-containing protein [Roseimicrobium gellanilyticum]RBP48255.1 ADP-ribose pyrophosphatase YjhB (NUDIX family) [Roseimicrobium gellanilyticum]